jgi:hypothetical protein
VDGEAQPGHAEPVTEAVEAASAETSTETQTGAELAPPAAAAEGDSGAAETSESRGNPSVMPTTQYRALGTIAVPPVVVAGSKFRVWGWFAHHDHDFVKLEILIDGQPCEELETSIGRPDVVTSNPDLAGRENCGFKCVSPALTGEPEVVDILLRGYGPDGEISEKRGPLRVIRAQSLAATWRTQPDRYGDWPTTLSDSATRFAKDENWAQADLICAFGLRHFPGNTAVLAATAMVEDAALAVGMGNAAEALRLWQGVTARRPDDLFAVAGEARGLLRTERFADLEALIPTFSIRFPRMRSLAAFGEMFLKDRSNPDVLLEFLDEKALRNEMQREAHAQAADADAMHDVITRFECLGANCSFGAVQRALGYEPVSLFRFGGSQTHNIVNALNADFAGVGDPEQTELFVHSAGRPEYFVRDRTYWLQYHTFTYADAALPEAEQKKLQLRHSQRLTFLARKLMEDLREGKRIFVHQNATGIPEEDMVSLFKGIRHYGNGALLCVTGGDSETVTLTELADGLWHGTIPGYRDPPDPNLNLDGWFELLKMTAEAIPAVPDPVRTGDMVDT